jgi:hypothetical protein
MPAAAAAAALKWRLELMAAAAAEVRTEAMDFNPKRQLLQEELLHLLEALERMEEEEAGVEL